MVGKGSCRYAQDLSDVVSLPAWILAAVAVLKVDCAGNVRSKKRKRNGSKDLELMNLEP